MTSRRIDERGAYLVLAALVILSYLTAAFVFPHALPVLERHGVWTPKTWFGFEQLRRMGLPVACGWFAAAALAALLWSRNENTLSRVCAAATERIYSHRVYLVLLASAAVLIFFRVRNYFINEDGWFYTVKFYVEVPTKGAHVTHDEMLELYVHSRAWYWLDALCGWSVNFTYQVFSCLAGGVFVYLLLLYSRWVCGGAAGVMFLLVVSGGHMQLYFGDIENYTLTGAWLMAYFLASERCLTRGVAVVAPAVVLAIAMCFHLLAGFLLPSLLYLCVVEARRGHPRRVVVAGGLFASILAATLAFFHFHHLPISDLYYHSHAFGHGGHFLSRLAKPSFTLYWQQFNLLALMCPAGILLLPLAWFGRIRLDGVNMHLIIACAVMIVFQFAWSSMLGVYNDWNLYANVALPCSLLVGRNFAQIRDMRGKGAVLLLLLSAFYAHSYSWIVGNHWIGEP